MSEINSTWYDMFPKYYENAIKVIERIKRRPDINVCVPNRGDEKEDLLEVEKKSQTHFVYRGDIKLRDILTRLQYLAHFNDERNIYIKPKCTIEMNILGKNTSFKLEESKLQSDTRTRGWQILVYDDADKKPTYPQLMQSLQVMDSGKLSRSILTALDTPLNMQTEFELTNYRKPDLINVRLFILLTHIAEAAVPSKIILKEFYQNVKRNKVILSPETRAVIISRKHGRTPMMDKIVRAKLRKIAHPPTFSTEFSAKGFPSQLPGGTQKSREHALRGYEIDQLSDTADDLSERTGELSIN